MPTPITEKDATDMLGALSTLRNMRADAEIDEYFVPTDPADEYACVSCQ